MISIIGVILLLVIAIHLFLPVVDLPSPKGKYQVGTQLFSFTDYSRKEIYASSNIQRMLSVQVWYPTEEKFCRDKQPEHYMEKESCKNFERVLGIPYLLRHLASVKTNSYKEVPISNQEPKYPVIIFFLMDIRAYRAKYCANGSISKQWLHSLQYCSYL